jgi:hypothetical protein
MRERLEAEMHKNARNSDKFEMLLLAFGNFQDEATYDADSLFKSIGSRAEVAQRFYDAEEVTWDGIMSALSAENSIHQGVSFGGDMLDKIAGANG